MGSIYNTPAWVTDGSITYETHEVVKDSSGKIWYATSSNDSTVAPAPDSEFWGGYINITIDGATTVEPLFLWSPSYNVSTSHQPKIKSIQFGDGYEQRIKHGINNNKLDLNLSFEGRSELEATAILHFLSAREGYQYFYFKPPAPYSRIKKFVCKTFNSTFVFADNYNVQANFLEVS